MLSHKDTESVQRIHHAASCIKPLIERILQSFHSDSARQSDTDSPSLLATVPLTHVVCDNWKRTIAMVANRMTPFWGPIDRLSLGLILREIGSHLFHPSLNLACAELILEHLVQADSNINLSERYDTLMNDLRSTLHNNSNESDRVESKIQILLRKCVAVIDIIERAVEELNLSGEFQRPFAYNGHDVRKVFMFHNTLS